MLETSARRPLSVLACLVATLLLTTACTEDKTAAPKPSPTPLADLDTTAMQVPRIEFCKLVPTSAVKAALGARADSSASYSNGDDVAIPGVGKEVVHETGCSWSTDAGTSARAWVFARPVDAAFARKAIASSRGTPGCRVTRGPSYGDPSVTQTCRSAGATRVRHAGLFGQTWLSCEVSDPAAGDPAPVRERADSWCVEVVNALDTSG